MVMKIVNCMVNILVAIMKRRQQNLTHHGDKASRLCLTLKPREVALTLLPSLDLVCQQQAPSFLFFMFTTQQQR